MESDLIYDTLHDFERRIIIIENLIKQHELMFRKNEHHIEHLYDGIEKLLHRLEENKNKADK